MNLLLIDQRLKCLETFIQGCNETTKHVTYGLEDSFEEVKTKIENLGVSSFNHVGFVFDNDGEGILKLFVSYNPFISFDESGINDNLTTQFIKEVVTTYNVETIDFLACDLLLNLTWKSYFEYLQNQSSDKNLIVRASNNKSGNLQHGGDWILESTNEDITSLYFNEHIGQWSHLLGILSDYNLILLNDEYNNIYSSGNCSVTKSINPLLRVNGEFRNSEYYFNKKIIKIESTDQCLAFITDETSNNLYVLGNNNGQLGTAQYTNTLINVTTNILNKKVIQVSLGKDNNNVMVILTDESLNNIYVCGNSSTILGVNDNTITSTATLQQINYLNNKIIMIDYGYNSFELITDETSNNIYYISNQTNRLYIKKNTNSLINKKIIYIKSSDLAYAAITDELSNNLYVSGRNINGYIGYIGLGFTNEVSDYTNASYYSPQLLNKKVTKFFFEKLFKSSFVLTDESSNNLYASGENTGTKNLIGIGNMSLVTYNKVSDYSNELLNKEIIDVCIHYLNTSVITSETSNNLYTTGSYSNYSFGEATTNLNKPLIINNYSDSVWGNSNYKFFKNISRTSELFNKKVVVAGGNISYNGATMRIAITDENTSTSNIYVTGKIGNLLVWNIDNTLNYFKKMKNTI